MSPLVIIAALLVVAGVAAYVLLNKKKAAKVAKPAVAEAAPVALSQREYAPFALQSKVSLTSTFHKTVSYRFALPAGHRLGLPVGKHISLRCITPEGKMVSRPYTPVSSDEDIGYFDLVVKVYAPYDGVDFRTKEPKSYAAGVMGAYLESLKLGDTVDVKGPQGELEYNGKGSFTILRKPKPDEKDPKPRYTQVIKARRVGMIAGGTGITPMLAIIREVMKRSDDATHLSLVFGNVVEEDILLRAELEAFAAKYPGRFNLHFILDKPPAGWTGSSGFVTADVCKMALPAPADDTLTLLCGPPGMIGACCKALASLGHKEENLFSF